MPPIPVTPFLGMGAAMALEDGVVCARCLAESATVEEAFARDEAARKERTKGVLLDSRKQGVWYQNTDPDEYAGMVRTGEMRVPLMSYDAGTVEI